MAKKAKAAGEVNKSQMIRDLLKQNPTIKANDAISTLGAAGVEINNSLFYFVKGSVVGRKKHRKKVRQNAVAVAVASDTHPSPEGALATIRKVQALAGDVGGMRSLKELVDALSE